MTDVTYPVPEDQDDARFRWLFDYWRERCRGERLPARSDMDPVDFPHLLGRIVLLDVVRNEGERPRYKIRLWGSIVRRVFDKDDTGKWRDETLWPGTTEMVHGALDECVQNKRPRFWRRPMHKDYEGILATRRLLLPLAADGETVDMLFGLLIEEIDKDNRHALDKRMGVA